MTRTFDISRTPLVEPDFWTRYSLFRSDAKMSTITSALEHGFESAATTSAIQTGQAVPAEIYIRCSVTFCTRICTWVSGSASSANLQVVSRTAGTADLGQASTRKSYTFIRVSSISAFGSLAKTA